MFGPYGRMRLTGGWGRRQSREERIRGYLCADGLFRNGFPQGCVMEVVTCEHSNPANCGVSITHETAELGHTYISASCSHPLTQLMCSSIDARRQLELKLPMCDTLSSNVIMMAQAADCTPTRCPFTTYSTVRSILAKRNEAESMSWPAGDMTEERSRANLLRRNCA